MENLIIIGSGPAGLTAAIYAARANLKPLVIEGLEPGGQLMLTTDVENYPGFPEGILGPKLMEDFKKQAARFGAEFKLGNVDKVDFSSEPLKLWVGDKEYQAKSVVVASGASARWLGIETEKKFMGRGVTSCATCDGAFYKNMDVIVVGGGDSAMEEATFLTKFASKVTIVHRREEFKASKIMFDRAKNNPKIEILTNKAVKEILGDKSGVTSVTLEDTKTNETMNLDVKGVFVAIGHIPNTKIFKGQLEMHENGYLKENGKTTETSKPGVFIAGDVYDFRYRQAVTAAGSGCRAAIDAEKYLETLGH